MNLLVIDIETTGFSPKYDKIVEIGATVLDCKTGKRTLIIDTKVYDNGVQTDLNPKAWIFENTDLKYNDVLTAPLLSELMPTMQAIISQYQYITSWNKAFDFGFLDARGFDMRTTTSCPMEQSTDYFQIPFVNSSYDNGTEYKWPKAQEAWDILFPDTPRTELHRAADDTDFEAKIIYELYKRGVYNPFN